MIAALPWPTWQHSGVATMVCLGGWALVRRRRPSRRTEIALPVLLELAVLCALYTLWRTAKKLPLEQNEGALDRARTIVDVQEAMFLPSELGVNELALHHDWLGWISSAYYAGMHVPGIFAFLIWMFWRHRDQYDRWRNVLAITTAGCLLIRFWRVAPPRFLPELGFVDVTHIHGMDVYGPVGTGVSGQFVAMPSIHVAWAGVVGVAVVVATTSVWRWIAALHLPLTVFVVSATGHHWWLDGIVALGLLAIAIAIEEAARRMVRRWRRRRAGPAIDGAAEPELATTAR